MPTQDLAPMTNPKKTTTQTRRAQAMVGKKRIKRVVVGLLVPTMLITVNTMWPAAAATKTIKIGFVSPQTGPLAGFGEADKYVIDQMTKYFSTHPLRIGADKYNVQIILKDAQSSSSVAASAAADLINRDGVSMILASSTPDIVNPVADQCEANAIPCITTVAPWQAYFLGRQKDPANPVPFKYTYHFFWGLEDVVATYEDIWSQVSNNKKAAALWPNDPDGQAWSSPNGFPPAAEKAGYSITNPGLYPNGTQDFTSQISAFKAAKAEVLLGVPIPPDFGTFWKQAVQQGYKPKVATIGKALLFPSTIEALGTTGQNLSTEVWWHPTSPFKSSLTRQTAKQLAAAYEKKTKKQWTQPLGFSHALFEVMSAAILKAKSTSPKALATALSKLKVNTVVGTVDWTSGPVPNVAKTPLAGGQWRANVNKNKYDLVIVSNVAGKMIPLGGKAEAIK
jgi:branched-chain amino acid transport system substrate-binding protein